MYRKFFKRPMDFVLSLCALIVLWPIMLVVAVLVRVKLGSPIIFTQARPGKYEKIFKMYKFRTMTDEKDENGELLPDSIRLTSFGKFLRSTSLDELPELWNIVKGDMSIVGPRPLLVQYLPYYNRVEKRRHDVRGGLIPPEVLDKEMNGSWERGFEYDINYVDNISFILDLKLIFATVRKVIQRYDSDYGGYFKENFVTYRRQQISSEQGNK